LLGQGGMGAVYKARQRRLDRLVALKILPPEVAGAPGFAERFTREAQALARLNHPHIVIVHDFGDAGGMYYFLMEFVDGVNLRQMIAGGKLEPREALAIVPQVCEALQYAHDEGIVHRDIKPENILLDRKGRAKIADFGLAKLLHGGEPPAGRAAFSLTGSRQVMGTPHYMAPEQMERPQGVDHRADIYSLGVVFYEMLTGELPLGRFAAPSRMVHIDVRLDEVVLRSLEKEPARRYQHASEVKTDLESISSVAPGSSPAALEPDSDLDGFHFKDVRSQVTLPALGLGFVGGVGFFFSFAALIVLLNLSGSVHEALRMEVVLAVLTLAISVLIAEGASAMARLRRYKLCRAASMLAILPCHVAWLIGLPAGLCAWSVLSRPDVRAAFQGKVARPHSRSIAREVLVIAGGCLIGALLVGALLVGAYLWSSARSAPAALPATVEAPAPTPTIAPRSQGWVLGPTGPALTDAFARHVLHLEPAQIERVDMVLRAIYAESLALEAPNTEQHYDESGHLVVTIEPSPGPIAKLENRLWSQLDEILSTQQQSIARRHLQLDSPQREHRLSGDRVRPGFFGWWKTGARIELWRVGTWYHWNVKVRTRGYEYSASDPQLPAEFRRFWKGSPNDPGLPP
jgi:hypothetical protein